MWPLAAAKWRGELRPPKVEYFERQGLNSSSILASTRSPSLAAETSRSPEAEHPSEFPIAPIGSRSASVSAARLYNRRGERNGFSFASTEGLSSF